MLDNDVNPTSVPLTIEDAITFFLAYLTDLATTELAKKIGSRYVRRRFTLPWWREEQRRWASRLIARSLARAQILADTFKDRWRDGIHVRELKDAIDAAAAHDAVLLSLLDQSTPEEGRWSSRECGGVLEPLAAASSRVWRDDAARNLTLVVDVGAGTTDVSLFWSAQNIEGKGHRAFPVEPCGVAIKQAGDTLDSLLVHQLLNKANLGSDPAGRTRASRSLYLSGVRRLKESLFVNGTVTKTLVNEESVTVTLDEFMQTDGVEVFSGQIRHAIKDLLSRVDKSWAIPAEQGITLVLTGGGSTLPMVQSLVHETWNVASKVVTCRLANKLPQFVEEEFSADFQQVYPQLAVAIGGAMPMLLDERRAQVEWHGGTPPPIGLGRYQTSGL